MSTFQSNLPKFHSTADSTVTLAVVDTAINDYETLIGQLDPGTEVVLIKGGDGLVSLAEKLDGRTDIDSIHVFSHGAEGKLLLGDLELTSDNIVEYAEALAKIGSAMSPDGDILLYGCNLATGSGVDLLTAMTRMTGADVAASDDLTGASALQGDWQLEVATGGIEASLPLAKYFIDSYGSVLALPVSSNQTSNYEGLGLADTAVIANGTVIDDISYDGFRFNGFGGETGIYPHEGSFTDNVNTTGTRVYTSDSSNFKLTSIDYVIDTAGNPANASLTFYGFRDGVQVESQTFNAADTSSGTWTLNWGSVDEAKFVANTHWIFMDNLKAGTEISPNATPVISINDTNLAYTEGSAATQFDGAGTVSDADGDAEWNGGSLSAQITGNAEAGDRISIVDSDGDGTAITISGTNIFANGTDIGDLSASGGNVTGGTKLTVTFDSDATNANVQEVLQSIRYDSTTDDPGTSNRTVTFTATDKNAASGSDTRTVVMTAVNDEPTLTANASNPTYTEGGAAASLFSGTDISTVESGQTVSGFTFTVTNVTNGSNERINVDGTTIVLTHGTNGSTASNSLNYSVSVIGTTATISLTGGSLSAAAAQTMVDNMSYQNNSNSPSTSNRVVTLTSIQDSGGTANGGDNTGSLAVASTVTVVQNNDEPTLTANGSNPTFTEGGAAGSLFSGASISTVEAGQTIKGVTFTVTNVTNGSSEIINIDGTAIVLTHGTSGSTATNSLNYSVMVIGTTATVSLTGGTLSTAATQTMLDNMSYQNNSNTPSTSNRVVTLTSIQDSGGTANGGDDTASVAVASTVTVVGVNDEPTLTANASNPTFTESGAAASLFSGTSIDTVESGQNITGLSFTITNVTNGSNERINVDGTTIVLTHGTNGSTAGNSLNYSVMVIGTTATVTMTGGNLSVAATQTLIDNMSYQNNSNSPSTSNRVVTLTSIQDSGGTANGGDNTGSLAVASTVTVVQNNDEPTLTANGSNPTFTEGGAAGSLFSGTSISTVEAGQTIKGFTFTVSNVANGISEVINIDGTAIILTHGTSGSTAGNSLSYSVTVVGTTATVALTGGTMSTATTQTLIDNMSYQNNSNAPSTSNRVVTLTSIQDSGGTANGGDDTASIAVASTVTIVDVNDEPTLTANASNPTFTESGAAASLFSGTSIDTVESGQNITGLSFTITNVTNGSNERINVDGTTIVLTHGTNGSTAGNSLNYSVMVIGTTATVTMTGGNLSVASAQTLIDNMSYQNNSNSPSTSNRVVTLTSIQDSGGTANGGDNTGSLAVASTVTVVQNNDEPTLTANGSNPTFTEGGAATSLFSGASVSTVESGQTLSALTLTVTNVNNGSDEILNTDGTAIELTDGASGITATNGLNYSVSVVGTTTTVSLTGGTLSAAAAQTLIDGISYQNNSNTPNTSNRVVTITSLTDSGGTANGGDDTAALAVASTVTISGVNDEPTLTATGSNPIFTEGGAAANLFSGASASTVESGQTLSALTLTVNNVNDGSDEILNTDGTAIELTDGASGITAANSLNYSVSVAGTIATVSLTGGTLSAAAAQILIDGISYQNNSNTPNTSNRVVTITSLTDSGGTANGGDDTAALAVSSTVSVVANPRIISAGYNADTGTLVVTGANIQTNGGGADIDASALTFTGEGGSTYTLTDSPDVELDSATQFTVILSAADKAAINRIVNKSGTESVDSTTYNLAAADDWNRGVTAGDTSDQSGNGIAVSNVPVPAITSATYNASTGALIVTGTGFKSASGAANDVIANKFTITGEDGETYTLTDTANVDITSGTEFALILSANDKAAVNQIINKNGTSSTGGIVYNLAAAEDWAAGADGAINIVDATGNGILANATGNGTTVPAVTPSSGGGGTTTTPGKSEPSTKTSDGVTIAAKAEADGSTTLTVPIVDNARIDDPDSENETHADISILTSLSGDPVLAVGLPAGIGVSVNGQSEPMDTQSAINDLVNRIEQETVNDTNLVSEMIVHGRNFIASLTQIDKVSVHTISFSADSNQNAGLPVIINGSNLPDDGMQALIINAANMPPGTIMQLNNVAFAAIIGAARVMGGDGENVVVGDNLDQFIVLGPDDDILFGGGGNDTIGSLGGDDQTAGDAGNDIVYGGAGNDILTGGSGNDKLNGGLGFDTAIQSGELSDYQITVSSNQVTLIHQNGETDTLSDTELVQFETGPSLAIAHSVVEVAAHHLVKTWLGRDLTTIEGHAVQNWRDTDLNGIARAFQNLPEAIDLKDKTIDELLAGLDNNPDIVQLDVVRDLIGGSANNQGYLPMGLALNVDGGDGHDVLRMTGHRDDVHLEQIGDTIEITRLEDGAMLSLKNAEMIAFDSGENVLLAHDPVEGILGRLFQTFFDRDATIDEWQMGREAIANSVRPEIILDWFQNNANLKTLSDTDYIQTIYQQTLNRLANDTELEQHLSQLENGDMTRKWLAVDIANNDEAITTIGNILLVDGV
ncbi:protein of unknown function [Nitrosomonas marina]|uniref:DUF4347 domain-containing protein n=1 Tax=Nitrosomonas marina TaxID=917 RepID=A0A1I0BH71_9PROT|nr:DUF4347 domain-containing protein [Nitrosomonas marina]SET05566.1 protein of unknown function [Nitrosomonas marina]